MVNGPIEVGMPGVKAVRGYENVGRRAPMKAAYWTTPGGGVETQTNPNGTVSYRVVVIAGPVFWTAITYNTGDPSPIPVLVN
jgi:hypothetical protein